MGLDGLDQRHRWEQPSVHRPTWVDVDLGALQRNYLRLQELVAPRRIWCVVKADAYGHGAVEVSRRLVDAGAEAFAVATVDEGIALRRAGIQRPVLVMAGIEPVLEAGPTAGVAAEAVAHDLELAVWSAEAVAALAAAAVAAETTASVHLKCDTGMGRLGVMVADSVAPAVEMAEVIAATQGVVLAGVMSNLAAADAASGTAGYAHSGVQIERFEKTCAALAQRRLGPPHRHLGNSAAIFRHEATWRADWCTGVRPGLALYGVPSFARDATVDLEPVMSWHAAIAAIREVPEGWPLGYGASRRADQPSRIAVLPVGYHDGFPRALGDRAEVLIGGRRAKVVGAISMDLTLVDITEFPATRVGDSAILMGKGDGSGDEPVMAAEIAAAAGTIAHEILCRVGARVPRHFVESAP